MTKVVWNSTVTAEMVTELDPALVEELIEALDDAVMNTCIEFGIQS